MGNTMLDEAQVGIKIAGRNINNLRYADDTSLMTESEELKSLLMNVKEESGKAGLTFSFFFFVITLTRTSSTMLNRNSESWYLCFVPDIRHGVGSFQSFIIELAVSFLYMLLIILRIF